MSRVLGMIRDMVMIPLAGGALADAFWLAFSIPNFFRRLFGEGALSAAFVPVFTDVAEREGLDRARVVLANVAGLLAMLLGGLVVLGELGLWVGGSIWPGDWANQRMLQFTAVMLPFAFTVCLLALGSAALNCRGHFAYPAFAPIMLNIGLITAACLVAPRISKTDSGGFFVIGGGLVATGVIQLVGVVWLLRRAGLVGAISLTPVLPEVKRMIAMMGPMLIPLSMMQVSALADRVIAYLFATGDAAILASGVVPCLYTANRLYQLPFGVLGISMATAIFPLLSRYAARDDRDALRDTTNRALRLCLFLGIPSGAALIVLARPVVAMLFQRGEFPASETARTATILQMYCLGMAAYFCNHMLLRVFFSRKDIRTPLLISCVLAVVNILLVVGGILTPLRSGAIGLATAITATVNALALTLVLRRRMGKIGLWKIVASVARTIVATSVMIGAILAAMWLVPPNTDGGALDRETILSVAVAIAAGAGAFFLTAMIVRSSELTELWATRKPRRET